MTIRIMADPYDVGTLNIGPDDVKFDIDIDFDKLKELGWGFSNVTSLAYVGAFQTASKTSVCFDDNSTKICVNSTLDESRAEGAWLRNLTCGNGIAILKDSIELEPTTDVVRDSIEPISIFQWTVSQPWHSHSGVCNWDPALITVGQPGSATTSSSGTGTSASGTGTSASGTGSTGSGSVAIASLITLIISFVL